MGTGANAEVTRHAYHPVTLIETGIYGPHQTTSPDQRSVAFIHDDLGRRTHTIVNGARQTVVGYDALDRMVSRTPPGLATELWTYFADTSTPERHVASDLTVTTYTLSNVTAQVLSRTVTKHGQAPVVIAMTVDRPAGSPDAGLVVTTSTAAGGSRSQEMDRAGRVVATEIAGERVASTYARANRLQTKGAESYGYDAGGRLHTITAPGGTATLGYDAQGLPDSVTLPNGVSRSWTYDAGHRIAGLRQTVAGDNAIWTVGRDGQGRIATVLAPDHQIAYTYRDGRLERERRTGVGAAEILYVSDTSDNRVAKATYAAPESNTEPFVNLPASVQPVSGGWTVADGVLSVAATGSADLVLAAASVEIGPELGVTLTIPIPASGEMAAGFQATAADGTHYRILWQVGAKPSPDWSFPGRGRLLVERIPVGGTAVEVGTSAWVDELGIARRLSVTHWPDSRLEVIATAGTQSVVYRFGAGEFGALPRREGWSLQVVGAGVTFDDLAWTHTSRREAHRYAVNFQDQVLTDLETVDGTTTVAATTSFLYDAKGNLDQQTRQVAGQSDAVTTYAYDPLDRLITLQAGGTIQQYGYAADTMMRTSAQIVGGSRTTWAFDGANPIRRTVTDSGNTTVTNYLNRGGRPLWEVTNGVASVYGKDIQDNVIGLVQRIADPNDPNVGAFAYAKKYSYDAFGNVSERFRQWDGTQVSYIPASALTSGPRYRGAWFDGGTTGLYKMGARYYDPKLGSFTQVDPIRAGTNWYSYCDGDPVNRADPTGLDWVWTNGEWMWDGHYAGESMSEGDALEAGLLPPDVRGDAPEVAMLFPRDGAGRPYVGANFADYSSALGDLLQAQGEGNYEGLSGVSSSIGAKLLTLKPLRDQAMRGGSWQAYDLSLQLGALEQLGQHAGHLSTETRTAVIEGRAAAKAEAEAAYHYNQMVQSAGVIDVVPDLLFAAEAAPSLALAGLAAGRGALRMGGRLGGAAGRAGGAFARGWAESGGAWFPSGVMNSNGAYQVEQLVQRTTGALSAIRQAVGYEARIRGMYPVITQAQRDYIAIVNGSRVRGVADSVASEATGALGIEAKYVRNWAGSIYNPASPVGSKAFAGAARETALAQARKYSAAFPNVVYHSNSAEFIAHYSALFTQAGLTNIRFLLTP